MEVCTHVLLFFLGLSLSFLLRHGFARSPDSTEHVFFASAVLTFIDHKGNRREHYYAGSFRTESRDPDKMVKELKSALLKLVSREMPEEIFQLSDKENYHIQIHSINRV